MELSAITFSKLSLQQLYDILQLRSEVFVVEQDCVYQDVDGNDQISTHILGYDNDILVVYARILPPNTYFKEASIGRVIVKESHRKHSYGNLLMKYCIDIVKKHFPKAIIKISAQQYLIKFYQSHGFETEGEGYLEDGIPHIAMYL